MLVQRLSPGPFRGTLLALLLLAYRADAQCPAVTNIQPNSITATTAFLNYNATNGPDYTRTLTPQGGPATVVRLVPPAYAPQQLTGLLPGTTYTVSIVTNCPNGQNSAPTTAAFITAPAPPANDDCATPALLPVTADCTVPTTGSFLSATPSLPLGQECVPRTTPANDLWYRFVAGSPTQILRVTARREGTVEVRTAPCAGGTVLQCSQFLQNYYQTLTTFASTEQISGLVPGYAYFVRVYPVASTIFAGEPAAFTLCLNPGPPVPANDECGAALLLNTSVGCSYTTGTVAGATASSVSGGNSPAVTGVNDVWYRFVAQSTAPQLTLEALDPEQTFTCEVRRGSCAASASLGGTTTVPSTPFQNAAPGRFTLNGCVPGQVYYVRVYTTRTQPLVEAAARFRLCLTGPAACPAPYSLPTATTSTTAQLNWQNASSPTSYVTLEYGPVGFVPGTGTAGALLGSTYTLNGLRPNTDYCYYVREQCTGPYYEGTSPAGGPFCFRTAAPPPGCDPPTNLAVQNQGPGYAQITWQYANSTTPGIADAFEVEYGPQNFVPGTGTLLTGAYPGQGLLYLLPSTAYCFYVRRNCGAFIGPVCFRSLGPAVLPDLVVNTAQTVAFPGAAYRNVTVTGTGTLALAGDLSVAGALVVQAGGRLQLGRPFVLAGGLLARPATLHGPGSVEVQDGATLNVFTAEGLALTGSVGAVQVQGLRTFSPGATYTYEADGAGHTNQTGPGLPATVRSLGVGTLSYGGLQLSQPVAVREVLALTGGNLDTNSQALTLLSDATGTALVDNTGGTVTGNVTVQRFINSPYQGIGYRHYSAPISTATVAGLATTGFTPIVNAAYNTAVSPGLVTPFPTVYGYDEARLATAPAVGGRAFDKGWASPTSLSDFLEVGRGYTVHLPGSALVSFTGTLNQGATSLALARGPGSDAGWHLLGNPYASPLDCATLTVGPSGTDNLLGVGAAIYVFESTGPYAGTYRAAVAGVGASPVIASGQGFFVRTAPTLPAGLTAYSFQLFTHNRVTAFSAADNTFHRAAAETRPLLTLALRDAAGTATDPASLYFAPAATPGFDLAYDAAKLPNPSGLNLASRLGAEDYAINGLPLLNAPLVLPLTVQVPAAGSYELATDQLVNFAPGTALYLRDALLNTLTLLTARTRYAFTLAGTSAPGRFSVEFRPAGALASAAQILEARVQLWPNPAPAGTSATVAAPAGASIMVCNTLGQAMQPAVTVGPASIISLATTGLATGLYLVRVRTKAGEISRRLVVE